MILAIDFGTSHTVAVLDHGDGRIRQLLFDGTPLLPSGVFAHAGGTLYTGRDAATLGRADPQRWEPAPKRRVDDGAVLLGDREWRVAELIAAVLARVAQEAVRVAGTMPPVVLTHPAAWGPVRREVLADAAARAGLDVTTMLAEPVAAAAYFARVLARRIPEALPLAVFDFGGGTVDVAMVRATGGDLVIEASDGLDDLGGIDLDAAIVAHVLARHGRAEAELDPAVRQELWAQARAAKESLSRTSLAELHVSGLPATHLTREEVEALLAPVLRRGVELAQRTFDPAGRADGPLAGTLSGLFLVGGSSRIPLVATLLHDQLGVAPTVLEQPEVAVAEGALRALRPAPEPAAPPVVAAGGLAAGGGTAGATDPGVRAAPASRLLRPAPWWSFLALGVLVAAAVVVLRAGDLGGGAEGAGGRGGATGPSASTPTPSASPSRRPWPANGDSLLVEAIDSNDPAALPAFPDELLGWSLGKDVTDTVRLYDNKHPSLESAFPVPQNHCGQLKFLITWRALGTGAKVRAQFVDPVDGTDPKGPAVTGAAGWMSATDCLQPSWLNLGDETGLVDLAVHYQVWGVS